MDLVINHVRQLNHVHDADRYFALELFACTTIIELGLTIPLHAGFDHRVEDVIFVRTVEDRCRYVDAKTAGSHAKVNLQHLPDVHP
ncbi:hypothetical protein D3C73_1391710 [compost metagenome]